MKYLFLAIGGVVGVIARYQLGVWISGWNSTSFPWATLAINVTGSLALGFFMRYLTGVSSSPEVRLMLTTGFCGGYTGMAIVMFFRPDRTTGFCGTSRAIWLGQVTGRGC